MGTLNTRFQCLCHVPVASEVVVSLGDTWVREGEVHVRAASRNSPRKGLELTLPDRPGKDLSQERGVSGGQKQRQHHGQLPGGVVTQAARSAHQEVTSPTDGHAERPASGEQL